MYRRHIRTRTRLVWRRSKRFVLHKLLHADDPPERLARGVAVGVFITFTPTIGVQSVLVIFLAWLLRANKLVGLPFVWITNPITFVPIYYPMYVIGAMLTGYPVVRLEWWKQLGDPPEGMLNTFQFYWERLETIAIPLWVGCLFVSMILGILAYFLTVSFVRTYRIRHWGSVLPRTIHKLTHIHQHARGGAAQDEPKP